ncbi:LutC/YkgG family protein [Dictyobacter aurantiacus]|uniref:Lactate utilization protein C n=1 Tax=Dictyobacter aurantiacus TaxID=1936993 RepID=A0A401ZM20_9CHLR|nr:lactate utilization protein C [Dictyobacter aurantiacus]GCE07903.1 lactate utilization protein C [Dictyobacter aurantiacus]
MSNPAREEMLLRIRRALANAPEPDPHQPTFRVHDDRERSSLLQDFIERLTDYKAEVTMTSMEALPQALTDICQQHGIQRLAVPSDLPEALHPAQLVVVRDEPPLSLSELDGVDGVITGCALAISQTGTIVLDGGRWQGRRALSLVPDRHLCIVRAEQVVGLVPEAIERLQTSAKHPLTFISGPSATSDIELNRVEGVHGPRYLHIFLINE